MVAIMTIKLIPTSTKFSCARARAALQKLANYHRALFDVLPAFFPPFLGGKVRLVTAVLPAKRVDRKLNLLDTIFTKSWQSRFQLG
jgi:hypothetical protein